MRKKRKAISNTRSNLHMVKAQLVKAALGEAQGNKAEATRILGIQRRLLYKKLTELGQS